MGVPAGLEATTRESLRAEIRELERQIWEAEHTPNLDYDYVVNLELDEMRDRRAHCVAVYWQWFSDDLVKEAIRWGIEVPDRADWWTEYKSVSPSTINPQTMQYKWLNEVGLSMISKQVKDAKLEYWKSVSQILVPILSLLLSILLAIIALMRS